MKQWIFQGWIFLKNMRKNFKLNLILIVILFLKSKDLYYHKEKLEAGHHWGLKG